MLLRPSANVFTWSATPSESESINSVTRSVGESGLVCDTAAPGQHTIALGHRMPSRTGFEPADHSHKTETVNPPANLRKLHSILSVALSMQGTTNRNRHTHL